MAQIKYGPAISGASGKSAGVVFSRNRSGAYIRNWAKPINPPSPAQSAQRAMLGMSSHEYSMISQIDRDGWDSLALTVTRLNRLGEAYTPTGRQIFVEANNNCLAADFPMITTAPGHLLAPQWETTPVFDVQYTADPPIELEIATITNLQDAPAGDALNLRLMATPGLPPSRRNGQTLYRSIINDAVGDPFPFFADYTFNFGYTWLPGNRILFAANLILGSNGMMSPTKYFDTTPIEGA